MSPEEWDGVIANEPDPHKRDLLLHHRVILTLADIAHNLERLGSTDNATAPCGVSP